MGVWGILGYFGACVFFWSNIPAQCSGCAGLGSEAAHEGEFGNSQTPEAFLVCCDTTAQPLPAEEVPAGGNVCAGLLRGAEPGPKPSGG